MGPVVGGFVGVASDLISYILSSQVYPPNLLVTAGAATVGIVSGSIAKFVIKNRGAKQIIFSAFTAHAIGSMVIKTIGLYQFYGMLVLWRIPLYLVIATTETLILCFIFRRHSLRRMFDSI